MTERKPDTECRRAESLQLAAVSREDLKSKRMRADGFRGKSPDSDFLHVSEHPLQLLDFVSRALRLEKDDTPFAAVG